MKEEQNKKTKKNGQVFTPKFIVEEILNYVGYNGEVILDKHIIDNSCGDGAFLCAVVRIYIENAKANKLNDKTIKSKLETYIHGIDNDPIAFNDCRKNLNAIAEKYGITEVNWDIYNQSSLSMRKFDGKMDYVVGNPPYVRVHNLDATYDEVKSFRFANGGMTDLYLAFFELGFNMLNENGQLCYITPSSWLNSVAAENMRHYIYQHHNMVALIDLGHFQAFENATAYTMISHFKKSYNNSKFDYYTFNGSTHTRDFVERLDVKDIYIDTYFYLSDTVHLNMLREIKNSKSIKYVSVKNGFATLADSVFIGDDIPDSNITIKILKGSTGKWSKCLFPYNSKGKPLPEEQIFANEAVKKHFEDHKADLLKGHEEYPGWYYFGRTQALADVFREKLAVNSLVRTKKDFKLIEVGNGEGIYSGLYIITDFDIDFQNIKDVIASDDCIEYIKILKKYKSGGYYTFNTKDLEQFINYRLSSDDKQYALKHSVSGKDPDYYTIKAL